MPHNFRARRSVARFAVASLAACLLVTSVNAAEPSILLPAPPPVREAVQAAWKSHPTYRVTEAELAASRARLDAANQPLYNPELELATDDEGPDRTTTAGVALTLDLSGKRRARSGAAAARLTQSEAEAQLRRRNYVQQWMAAWVDVGVASRRVSIGDQRQTLVTRFAALADRQFAADDISGLDRDVALLARDEADAEQAKLIAELSEASARFRALGGTSQLAAQLGLPETLLAAPSELDEAALQRLPEWAIADAALLGAQREIVVAERNRIPDPRVSARGGRINYGGLRDNVFGVTISVPMPVRNSYRAEVVVARAEADAAAAEADRIRAQLAAESRRVVESFSANRDAWQRWTASRGTDVERRAELLERLWREGELSTSDYLLQLNQTLDTALAGAALQARLWLSYFDYLAASGQLERWSGLDGTP
ncbi:MAG: TolC family protein [Dokdonella sp.]